jgi:hypothetical protein
MPFLPWEDVSDNTCWIGIMQMNASHPDSTYIDNIISADVMQWHGPHDPTLSQLLTHRVDTLGPAGPGQVEHFCTNCGIPIQQFINLSINFLPSPIYWSISQFVVVCPTICLSVDLSIYSICVARYEKWLATFTPYFLGGRRTRAHRIWGKSSSPTHEIHNANEAHKHHGKHHKPTKLCHARSRCHSQTQRLHFVLACSGCIF